MTKNDEHKLWVLQHAERTGQVAKTCRYFGIGRASFYRWKRAYEQDGEAGLVNAKTIPKNPPNQTPTEVAGKVLHLRRQDHQSVLMGKASTGPSNAINRTHGVALIHDPRCATPAGPNA